jgi:hypothetical protein
VSIQLIWWAAAHQLSSTAPWILGPPLHSQLLFATHTPAELIVRRIIVFVLVCVLLLPMFEANYGVWGKWQGVDQGGLAMLHNMALQVGGEAPPQPPGWPSFNTTFGMALQVRRWASCGQASTHLVLQGLHLLGLHVHVKVLGTVWT